MRYINKSKAPVTIATAVAFALVLGGCGSMGADDGAAAGPTQTQQADETMADMDMSAVEPMSTGDPFADARTAAGHMPMTGLTLATGFAAAADVPGEVDSEAAALRADLTGMLQEHVYLAGMAVATAYATDPESEEFELAAATLDKNSVALADAVGELAGDDARGEFLRQWRDHVVYFVDYAVAAKAGDHAAMDAAKVDLDGYIEETSWFFNEISDEELPVDDVAKSLTGHVESLSMAIDQMAAGDTEAYESLRKAAEHVGMGAESLATGLAAGAGLEGDASDEASTLRSQLTFSLQEHVYLASIAVFTAYTSEGGTDSDEFTAAADALDVNTVMLSEAIESLSDQEQGEAFLELWREHIGYFVDYANAKAMDDDQAAMAALGELDSYRGEAGAFFEDLSGGELPAEDIAEGLGMHVQTLAGAIDSLDGALVK